METLEPAKKNPWGELAAILVAVAVLFYFVEWSKIVAVLTVAVGLGFVIFWHELGHFLVAKWSDVRILKFSIGFGLPGVPPVISYRKGMGFTIFGTRNKEYEELLKSEREGIQHVDLSRIGETEYALGVLPLGGFVRMLGEDPADEDSKTTDPASLREQAGGRAHGHHLGRCPHELGVGHFCIRCDLYAGYHRESRDRRRRGRRLTGLLCRLTARRRDYLDRRTR